MSESFDNHPNKQERLIPTFGDVVKFGRDAESDLPVLELAERSPYLILQIDSQGGVEAMRLTPDAMNPASIGGSHDEPIEVIIGHKDFEDIVDLVVRSWRPGGTTDEAFIADMRESLAKQLPPES